MEKAFKVTDWELKSLEDLKEKKVLNRTMSADIVVDLVIGTFLFLFKAKWLSRIQRKTQKVISKFIFRRRRSYSSSSSSSSSSSDSERSRRYFFIKLSRRKRRSKKTKKHSRKRSESSESSRSSYSSSSRSSSDSRPERKEKPNQEG